MSLQKSEYVEILNTLKAKIRSSRSKAASAVNVELLKLHWEIGTTILEQQAMAGWGAKIIDKLAADLKSEFPDFKGLSARNLKYMRAFAEAYPAFGSIVQPAAAQLQDHDNQDVTIVQAPIAQIPWTHHTVILDRLKTPEERVFYIEKTSQNGWSKSVLALQIESKLHLRQGNAITNFQSTLPSPQSDLAQETLKNPYLFDFISFSEEMQEREVEKAMIQSIKKFMLELGRGFAYVGNQKNVNVNGDDFFLDMLFYNYHLHCFVVVELKIGDFQPEFAGKLNFYVNTVNEQIKGVEDKPTIGILLCKTPNETVVKYALTGIQSPIGVAEYELEKALPKQLKGEIPTVEEFEAEIEKEMQELKKPVDKKYDRLKALIADLNQVPVKELRSPEICAKIFEELVLPLRDAMLSSISEIAEQFKTIEVTLWVDGLGSNDENGARDTLSHKREAGEFRIDLRLKGFKRAGVKAFDISKELTIATKPYNYTIYTSRHQPIEVGLEKLYHEKLSTDETQAIIERFKEMVIDDITAQLERIKNQNA